MTALLEKAIRETDNLTESEQDFIANLVLQNIQDNRMWDEQFAGSLDVLETLFDEAMTEYQAGLTKPLHVDS